MIYFNDSQEQVDIPKPKQRLKTSPTVQYSKKSSASKGIFFEVDEQEKCPPADARKQFQTETVEHSQNVNMECQSSIAQNSEQYPEQEQVVVSESEPQLSDTKTLCNQLIQHLLKQGQVKQLCFTPVPEPLKFCLQVVVSTKLLQTTFKCYINYNNTKQLIMEGRKKKSLMGNQIIITSAQGNHYGQITYAQGSYNFIDNGTFSLGGSQRIRRRLGALRIIQSYSSKLCTLIIPSVVDNKMSIIEANEMSDFFKLKSSKMSKAKLTTFKSTCYSKKNIDSVQHHLKFKPSSHTLLLTQEADSTNLKLIVGKIDKGVYKLGISSGISPIQAFCTGISWLSE